MVLAKKIFWLKGVLKKNFLLITIFFSDLGVFWKICLGGFLHCLRRGSRPFPSNMGLTLHNFLLKNFFYKSLSTLTWVCRLMYLLPTYPTLRLRTQNIVLAQTRLEFHAGFNALKAPSSQIVFLVMPFTMKQRFKS